MTKQNTKPFMCTISFNPHNDTMISLLVITTTPHSIIEDIKFQRCHII